MPREEPETGGPSGDDPTTSATTPPPPPPPASGLPKTPPPTNLPSSETPQSSGDKSMADNILPMEKLNISEEPETGEPSGDDTATPPASSDLSTSSADLSSSAATQSSRVESKADKLISLAEDMWGKLEKINFSKNPFECKEAYNAVQHSEENHTYYIETYGNSTKSVLFLGMNPGPCDKAQITGVPFGETDYVKDWLKITDDDVKFGSRRSGTRFWKLCKDLCGTPEKFFKECFVYDYCPLTFKDRGDTFFNPEKLSKEMRLLLFKVCDEFLCRLIKLLEVKVVVAIGNFAKERAMEVEGVRVVVMTHPSPKNIGSDEKWQESAEKTLMDPDHDLMKYIISK